MKGKKVELDAKDDNMSKKDKISENNAEVPVDNNTEPVTDNNKEELNEQLEALKKELDEKTKQCNEYLNMLQRTAAEFENYKKRTSKEKEALYSEAVCDVTAAILPVVDNIERAVQASSKDNDPKVLKEGIELVFRQVKDAFKSIDVEEMDCVNKNFDPQMHNAVMHIEDDSYDQNIIIEEFQKGYIYKDKVIRHSMVKVAN